MMPADIKSKPENIRKEKRKDGLLGSVTVTATSGRMVFCCFRTLKYFSPKK